MNSHSKKNRIVLPIPVAEKSSPYALRLNKEIMRAGGNRDMHQAGVLYSKALTKGVADQITFASMITVAGNNGNLNAAYTAYCDAGKAKKVNSAVSNSMITAAGKNGDVDLACQIYNAVLMAEMQLTEEERSQGIQLANAITHCCMIIAMGQNHRVDLAQVAYENAVTFPMNDIVTYTSMITVAGIHGDCELAYAIYQQALVDGFADVTTHNCMISAAEMNGNMELANTIYEFALSRGEVNEDTFKTILAGAKRKTSHVSSHSQINAAFDNHPQLKNTRSSSKKSNSKNTSENNKESKEQKRELNTLKKSYSSPDLYTQAEVDKVVGNSLVYRMFGYGFRPSLHKQRLELSSSSSSTSDTIKLSRPN